MVRAWFFVASKELPNTSSQHLRSKITFNVDMCVTKFFSSTMLDLIYYACYEYVYLGKWQQPIGGVDCESILTHQMIG